MYTGFFNLQEKPFNLAPDSRYLYLNANHSEVLASLKYGIGEKRGFIVITGEVGTGKTTHLFNLLDQLGEKTVSAFIFNPILTRTEFFQYIYEEFNLPSGAKTKTEFLVGLNHFLLDQAEQGNTTVLVIDEAQNLSDEILEEVRLLSNLETPREKLLQIVLVGQPELDEKLKAPSMRQLKQRISIRCRILPFGAEETGAFVRHRLKVAGFAGEKQIFGPEVVALIARLSSGIPRVINNICDNVLLSCYALGRLVADRETVLEVAGDLDLEMSGLQGGEETVVVTGPRAGEGGVTSLALDSDEDPSMDHLAKEIWVSELTKSGLTVDAPDTADHAEQPAMNSRKSSDDGESGPLVPISWERSMRFFQHFIDRLKLENE